SHANRDKEVVVRLIDSLASAMGVPPDNIFCTSSPGHDIPPGAPFFDYMRRGLERSSLILNFITPAFLKSQFCMLQLGAALAYGRAFPMLVPPLDQGDMPGGPVANIQATPLSADGLDRLMDRVQQILGAPRTVAGWGSRRDRALQYLTEVLDRHQQIDR